MNSPQRIVIVGASSAMAEHCARLWVQRAPVQLVLLGRDSGKLERIANDLRVRSPQSEVEVRTCDFLDPQAIGDAAHAIAAGGHIDIVLIAHGTLPEQQQCQTDLAVCNAALQINGVSPVLFAEAFALHLKKQQQGTLAIIGSVAGDRGRKSNYSYGAAKGLVSRYAEGMQHRFAATAIKVVLIKPGPTQTPMTAHLQGKGPALAPVEQVAADILQAIDHGTPVRYTPAKWRLIMAVIKLMPRFLFHKTNI